MHRMPFGAELEPDGGVRFRVWAPEAAFLGLALEGVAETLGMNPVASGWHELTTEAATAGSRYRFVLPSGLHVPDPVSRFQPEDVSGPSAVTDPRSYTWTTANWIGRPWNQTVLYELHVGAFTPEGTFHGAESKLEHLATLGITAIEIMSIGDFPGTRNWGYDGVLLYAPDSTYGTPDDLKHFVDAAHSRGIQVILDVVYNHFGPEGNYLPQLFPDICTDRYTTPWGQALNFDSRHSERTREFIIHNALYWIEEFRLDGLRLDAVHAIIDSSSMHVLDELAQRVRSVAVDRHVHLILESDDTMWIRLIRDESATPLLSTAQWNHDGRQLLVLGLTSERTPEQDRTDTDLLGRALVEGFTSQPPKWPPFANPATAHLYPEPPRHIPPAGFIAFLQTHDLVGNRIGGERITHLARAQIVHALATIYLLSPQIPMLFMGEEWGASSPFPYFCDFKGDLADAVRRGRLEQFSTPEERLDSAFLASVPDPLAEQTYLSAKLHWDELGNEPHRSSFEFYRRVLAVRHEKIIPLLANIPQEIGTYEVRGPRSLEVRWKVLGGELRLDANLSDDPGPPLSPTPGELLLIEGFLLPSNQLGPWSIRWSLDCTPTT